MELLEPYRGTAIATCLRVHRVTVMSWKKGFSLPAPRHIPRLAGFLRVSVAELALLVATDAEERDMLNRRVRHAA
jgi:hypothetical protein